MEFLNGQMDPAEVIAIEIRQYVGQGLTALVPKLIGQTAEAETKKPPTRERRTWDENSFFAALEASRGTTVTETARCLLAWAKERDLRLWWGHGAQSGSFFPMLDHNGRVYWLFSVWTYGTIEVQFEMMKTQAPLDDPGKRTRILERLNAIPGVRIAPVRNGRPSIDVRPNIQIQTLAGAGVLEKFTAVFDEVIAEIRASEP